MSQPRRVAQPTLLILASSLILSMLACQLQLGGPKPPGPPVDIPPDALALLKQAWASALDAAGQTGEVTFTIDEPQLNALVRQKLAGSQDPLILQPQIYLRQGQIQVYGVSTQGLVEARIHFSIRPFVNPDGQLEFEIPTAEFGPLPAPDALKEAASRSMDELLAGTFGPLVAGFRVTSIVIHDGQMAIAATIR